MNTFSVTTKELSELTSYLTPQERGELDQLLSSASIRVHPAYHDFTEFKRHLYKRYEHPDHLRELDARLTLCARHAESGGRDGISHLIVEMPPRHGKTMSISRLFPTWYLGRNPDHRVILASYGASLAQKNSRYARNILLSDRYQEIFARTRLAQDSQAADAWGLEGYDGGLDAMGVGGGVTGKGGHIIIVDDPVKSREEAESQVYRDKVWDWFTDDLYTRREPGAAVIVVMTRWHMDDLVGRLLKEQPELWQRLRLPALAEEHDPLGRHEGEALWPARYPVEELRRIKDMQHEYAFSALYQQHPVPAEGGLFKRRHFHEIEHEPHPDHIAATVRFWDLAMSEKTSADYTVGVKMALLHDGRFIVLHVHRVQLDWPYVPGEMADIALADGPEVVIGFEEKGYMSRAGQDLTADARLHAFSIWGYPKDKDKLTNALPFASRVGQDQVDVLKRWWTGDYLDELCAFPMGAHDDQVDASAGAYDMLGTAVMGGALNHAPQDSLGAY